MSIRRLFRMCTFVAILTLATLPGQHVYAAGSAPIYGDAHNYEVPYHKARFITQDTGDTVGPSVAHKQTYGPGGLRLSAWDCRGDGSLWDVWYHQEIGYLRWVADGIPAGEWFCLATYRSVGTGEFGGTLWWD